MPSIAHISKWVFKNKTIAKVQVGNGLDKMINAKLILTLDMGICDLEPGTSISVGNFIILR